MSSGCTRTECRLDEATADLYKAAAENNAAAVNAHLAEAVIPHIANPTMQWFLAGAAATGALLNQRVLSAMRMAGLVDEDGMVDVDKCEAFSKAAFKAQPRIDTPFAVAFEQTDADAFLNRLRRG